MITYLRGEVAAVYEGRVVLDVCVVRLRQSMKEGSFWM